MKLVVRLIRGWSIWSKISVHIMILYNVLLDQCSREKLQMINLIVV